MEIQGLTPIDTLFEFVGHSVGLRLGDYLIWEGYLLWFVVAGGILRLYYNGAKEGTFKDLAAYPIYVLLIAFLVYPIDVAVTAPRSPGAAVEGAPDLPQGARTIRVPRLLAFTSAITDALQSSLISDVRDATGSSMHEWERIAAINEKTRLINRDSRLNLAAYTRYCYWPVMAEGGHPEGDPWTLVPLVGLPIDDYLKGRYSELDLWANNVTGKERTASCGTLHDALGAAIADELRREKFHQNALKAYETAASAAAAEYDRFYRRKLVYNEIYIAGSTETGALQGALPEAGFWKNGGFDLSAMPVSIDNDSSTWSMVKNVFTNLPAVAISIASTISEWWNQRAMGPAAVYRVASLGPYIYGGVILILYMSFPLAALFAFWPNWWTALVNYLKLLVSIKLWPIFWSVISGTLASGNMFNPETPGGFDSAFGVGGFVPAFASMYLMVPIFAFKVVGLVQDAGGSMLGMILGGASGASMREAKGMAGEVVGVGASAAKGAIDLHHKYVKPTD